MVHPATLVGAFFHRATTAAKEACHLALLRVRKTRKCVIPSDILYASPTHSLLRAIYLPSPLPRRSAGATPQSTAPCFQTVATSDSSLPTTASTSGCGWSAIRQPSSTAAASWWATRSQSLLEVLAVATGFPDCRPTPSARVEARWTGNDGSSAMLSSPYYCLVWPVSPPCLACGRNGPQPGCPSPSWSRWIRPRGTTPPSGTPPCVHSPRLGQVLLDRFAESQPVIQFPRENQADVRSDTGPLEIHF